ncbi:MAG: WecB/TagA/CpsF family glycosyltransferase [Candidatus Aminicenantes bacterium]|nr:WecB/TagA/CpsF family glycosyltransferase [Candidatus Aminicenantes bacterium]
MRTNIKKVTLFNTEFVNVDRKTACDILEQEILKKGKFTYAAVKDVALTVRSSEDEFLRSFYKSCDYIFVDGRGILYASWLLGKPLKEMVGGPGIYFEMLKRSNDKGYKIYLLGSDRESLTRTVTNIKRRLPGVDIVGYQDGYFNLEDSDKVVNKINKSKPDIVFIGISTPKREQFVERHRNRFSNFLCIPVGGVLDNEAGITKFAPKIIGTIGLEWLYRVLQEPNRLLKRYLYTHIKFGWYFFKELFHFN